MKILVTGAWRCSQSELDKISAIGHNVVFMQNESDDIPCEYTEIEGVICNGLFLYHDIEKFKNLKYIQLTSAGFDRVPMNYVTSHGIKINNARGVYSIPMAEFAISGVLALYKQNKFFYKQQETRKWTKRRGLMELYDKNVLIIGCGNVGNECAKRFRAFGCNVCGVDLYPREDSLYEKIYGLDMMQEKISGADVVVLTLPLTDKTRYLFDEKMFRAIKQGSVIVNVARGAVIEQNSLIDALQNDLLGGAVLDVFEEEPLSENSPFWDMENVIVTPHNSFVGDGNDKRLFDVIFRNLEDYNENNCSST